MISIVPFNETYIKIRCSDFGIEQELSEFLCFFAPNYKYMPSFRSGQWDGKIRLYNMRTKTLYKGLIPILERFCERAGYELLKPEGIVGQRKVTRDHVTKFLDGLELPHDAREYQIDALIHAFSNDRAILLSATSSGKSLLLYSMIRLNMQRGKKSLLIVPNINLVKQMYSDFAEYSTNNGWSVLDNVHVLYSGQERVFESPVIISTWQTLLSMLRKDKKSFDELAEVTDCLYGDEAHQLKSDEVAKVIEGFTSTVVKIGTTGTIDDKKINELVLTGLFGPVHKVITAKELIDAGQATDVEVRIINLKHPEYVRESLKGMKYPEEVQHIMACAARNKFIANLAVNCKGNVLILYNQVAKHGNLIHRDLIATGSDRPVYYIHGGVDADEREQIRQIVQKENNAIILATSSLMSTGTNIPSIENIIFALGGRSMNRIRQSIGRGIRLKEGKTLCKVFDLCDDYRFKKFKNTTFAHMEERIQIYSKEQFTYKIIEAPLNY